MDGRKNRWTNELIDRRKDGWMGGWADGESEIEDRENGNGSGF